MRRKITYPNRMPCHKDLALGNICVEWNLPLWRGFLGGPLTTEDWPVLDPASIVSIAIRILNIYR